MAKIFILNGPNLDKLGTREPEIYGSLTLKEIEEACVDRAKQYDLTVDFRQSNSEAELIDWLHLAASENIPVIINPAAFTHYSVAIRDAAALLKAPLIEVHITNPMAREEFRHTSLISGLAKGTVTGFGLNSYLLAIDALADKGS